ncbi:MAG: glycerol-3-phosphate dehydrogenase, partial [Burkholderiales bacterium]
TLVDEVLGDAKSVADLGEDFGGGLYERELRYLIANEWAREADDVLWRRTKCGLHMSAEQRSKVREYMAGVA